MVVGNIAKAPTFKSFLQLVTKAHNYSFVDNAF